MTERRNMVPYPPSGLIIALQYWNDGVGGDEAAAMRLARLMADIEPARRSDVTLMFCRRFDTPVTGDFWRTFLHCGMKFPVGQLTSRREGVGHPAGSNALWSGTMDQLASAWRAGNLSSASVFTVEADGVPLKRDWLNLLKAEHEAAIWNGKRVTGCRMTKAVPHVNGQLIAELSLWFDRPSLHETPSAHAWDMYHAAAFLAETQHTTLISNPYGTTQMSDSVLTALAHETCWLSNTKDDTAIAWAERTLVDRLKRCSQCGEPFAARACGFSHATIQGELEAGAKLGTEEATPGPRRVTVRG